jgi:protocatechuate 3,4-dioxygenase beta subunit
MVARVSGQSRIADRLIALLALLVCMSFGVGLRDVALGDVVAGPAALPPPVDASERDAELTVSVRSEQGDQPLANASVRVFWERGGKYYLAASARTDGSGQLALEKLPRGAAWVVAEAEGYARSSTELILGGDPRVARVALPVASKLRVHVEDEAGAKLVRATVLVTAADPLPFGALTDESGAATFERIGPAPWTVKASAPGHESVTRPGVTSDITLSLRRLGSLEVRVEAPDGSPAAGASVVIAGSSLWPARRAETDASGRVRIAGLLAGAYDLKATRGELVTDTLLGLVLARGEHQSVTLRLHPGRSITALVTDGDGDSPIVVPGADVVLVEQGLSSFPLRGRTGTDGKVSLGPISPGPATLSARAAEFVPRGAVAVPEASNEPVRIALVRGATLKGEVVDARGDPIDGASVEIIGTDLDGLPIAETPALASFRSAHFEWALPGPAPLIPAGELGVMPGPVPPIPPAFGAGALGLAAPDPTLSGILGGADSDPASYEPWVTRLDGRFTARPVTPGRVRALVRHPAYVEGVSDAVTLAPGGEGSVKLVLLSGGTLEGRVLDDRGQPIGGVRVDLQANNGTLERMTLTAADGSFAFAAVPADVVLSLARPEDPSTLVLREAISVAEGEKKVVELRLPAARGALRIVVKDESGASVDAAQVTVLSLDPKAPLRRTLFTGPDGTITLADAAGLGLRVVVEAPGWARAARNVDAAPELIELVLARGVTVAGRITAVRGRRFVSGASVMLVSDGLRKSAITDAQGAFSVADVSPGPARVVVSHPEFADAEVSVDVKATGRADRPLELDVIDLSEPGVVEGEVVDAAGKPVLGARVAAGAVPAYLPAGTLPAGMAVTDRNGRFKLSGVAPGNVDIEAYAADVGRGVTRAVSVSGGRSTSGVRIRLTGAADDAEPAAIGGVAVTLGERGSAADLEIVVVNVAAGSEAERAGLHAGDVIDSLDGKPPSSMADARARLAGPPGSDVVLTLRRGDAAATLRVAREPVRR